MHFFLQHQPSMGRFGRFINKYGQTCEILRSLDCHLKLMYPGRNLYMSHYMGRRYLAPSIDAEWPETDLDMLSCRSIQDDPLALADSLIGEARSLIFSLGDARSSAD
jgi:hypothetical protein